MEIKKILVPVDRSARSKAVVEYAYELAQALNNPQMDLLHVVRRPGDYLPLDEWIFGKSDGTEAQKKLEERFRQAANKAMQEFTDELPDKIRACCQGHIRVGDSVLRQILTFTEEHDYDLIVMGTHSRKGASHLFLGSVAEQVMRQAPCPVLIVR